MIKSMLFAVLLASCAASTPRVPSSKPARAACENNTDCSSQDCDAGICAPHQLCSGPADCTNDEACWTGVGCVPARCDTSKDCYQGSACRSDGYCSYGE